VDEHPSPLFWAAVAWLGLLGLVALTASWLPIDDPDQQDLTHRLAGPLSGGHLLGTDGLGRDLLARLVHGARLSLAISGAAVVVGLLVGGALGLVAGFVRGPLEAAILWLTNVVLAFPGLVFLLGLVAFAGRNLPTIIGGIAVLSAPAYARVARAGTLSVAENEYVLAARVLGATRRRILVREVLPGVLRSLLAFGLTMFGVLLVLESSLAFLGLSIDAPSWGDTIAQSRRHLSTTPNPVIVTSVAVFLTVLATNLVGDVLRSRFDVKESVL
jgi:peptide/nickel transport system permease protein